MTAPWSEPERPWPRLANLRKRDGKYDPNDLARVLVDEDTALLRVIAESREDGRRFGEFVDGLIPALRVARRASRSSIPPGVSTVYLEGEESRWSLFGRGAEDGASHHSAE